MVCCMIERGGKESPDGLTLYQRLLFVFVARPGEIVSPGLVAAIQKKVLSPPCPPCGSSEARFFFVKKRKIFLYFVTENRNSPRKRT